MADEEIVRIVPENTPITRESSTAPTGNAATNVETTSTTTRSTGTASTASESARLKQFRIGAPELFAVWPLLAFAAVLILMVYGIIIYESLFRLPLLAPVK